MDPSRIVTFLSGGIIVAIFNHYAGKRKEIQQHQQERREGQYIELLDNLAGFFEGTGSKDKKSKFMLELSTNAMLFASTNVIREATKFLEAFNKESRLSVEERDKLANSLVLAIRNDMKVDRWHKLSLNELKRFKLD